MDLLSEILDTLALRGQLYFRTCFSGPWAIAVPHYERAIRFHLVAQGECYVRAGEDDPVHLRQGDLVLIPGGASHSISFSADAKPAPLEEVIEKSGYDGGTLFVVGEGCERASTQLICGHFTFAEGSDHPMLRSLPPLLHVSASVRAGSFWLDETLRLIAQQMIAQTPGSEASVRRISEVIFIETIRACAEQSEPLSQLLEALTDPKISRAILAMHKDSAAQWTVETLAAEAAMSRSRFAERFQSLVGCGPLTYLAEWRLQRAKALLGDPRVSIQEVAGRIGYQSPAAFTRAFANMFGQSPSDFRRSLVA